MRTTLEHPVDVPLDTGWVARPDPDRLGERYPQELHYTHAPDARWMRDELGSFADRWTPVRVPADWSTYGFGRSDTAWFRTVFDHPGDGPLQWVLRFDAVDYEADAWLNEVYLGSHEGAFDAFAFDVADLLRATGNVLTVRVHVPEDAPGVLNEQWQLKRTFRGAIARWDMNDPELRPGGITGPVSLVGTGGVRLDRVRVRLEPLGGLDGTADAAPALVSASAELAVGAVPGVAVPGRETEPVSATVVLEIRGPGDAAGGDEAPWREVARTEATCLAGRHPLTLTARLDDVRLWWTWDLGAQPLYDVRLSVLTADGAVSDRRVTRTGARRLERSPGWDLRLNGFAFYQRGANHLSDQKLAEMTTGRYRRDVELLREANLNTVHPFCVVERDAFYDECDRQGVLVYQDAPPVWLMSDPASSVVREGVRQLAAIRERLDPHPSVAIWTMGSQPSVAAFEKLCSALVRDTRRDNPGRVAHQANALLDLEGSNTHPVGSFFWERETAATLQARHGWQWDTHIYQGWYFDAPALEELPLEDLTLVTEFGAQAVPDPDFVARHFGLDRLDARAWDVLSARGMQAALMRHHVGEPATIEELSRRSQAHQARVLRRHIETYRRHKFAPNRGAHLFAFVDCWPSVSWSILDAERRPKAAFHAVARAMAPVQAFLDPAATSAGSLGVVVVNDTRDAFDALEVAAVADSGERGGATIGLPANGVVRVTIPLGTATRGWLELRLGPAARPLAVNRYEPGDPGTGPA
jgi:beta-mannosidase